MDDTTVYTVVRRLKNGMVLVRTDDGLEIPFLSAHLIKSEITPENLSSTRGSEKGRKKIAGGKKSSAAGGRGRIKVVDLHFADSANAPGSPSTIELQLLRFRSELDAAIRDGLREITFIHGIGNGILKKELRKILSMNYPSLSYHDASFIRYGYGGATQVELKKR